MRSTFIKIFLSFWLAQFLIIIFTLFVSVRQFESTAIGYTSSFAVMRTLGRLSLQAYDAGGCTALKAVPNKFFLDREGPSDQPAVLFDPANNPLCQNIDESTLAPAVQKIRKDGYMVGEKHGAGYVLGVEVPDASGRKFVYVMRGTFPTQIYIPYRDILPRIIIALIVSVLVTFGIALVITRPDRTSKGSCKAARRRQPERPRKMAKRENQPEKSR